MALGQRCRFWHHGVRRRPRLLQVQGHPASPDFLTMANFDLKDRSAIVGVGESPYGRRLMRSPIDLASVAIANALDDAGLTRRDLDGLIVSFGSPIGADGDTLAQVLGLNLRAYNQTWAHG